MLNARLRHTGLCKRTGVASKSACHSDLISELCNQAWVEQISLSATGYYRTPGIAYDHSLGQGTPFFYYAYGAAITEVSVNTLTGENIRLGRVDILHDVGNSLIPAIDKGQVEGAFAQGIGWLSTEELRTHSDGRLPTHSPSTYKSRLWEICQRLSGQLLENPHSTMLSMAQRPWGSTPFILAISLVTALQHALSTPDRLAPIQMPCTSSKF